MNGYTFVNTVTGETFTAPATEVLDKLFADGCTNFVMGKTEIEAPKRTHVSHRDHTILQMDAETGKVIAEFPTQKAALEAIGRDPKKSSMISDCINGKVKNSIAYGYKWALKNPNA